MNLQSHNGGWQTVEVARAQRELVERELESDFDGAPNAPIREFRKVFEWLAQNVQPPILLLDVGCGVGHYGVLCDRYSSDIIYTGADNSYAMVSEAWQFADQYGTPSVFFLSDWSDNDYSSYDVVLVSQIAEMTEDPPKVIEFILRYAKRFVILHRLRLTGKVGRVYEKTYCDHEGQNWVWNQLKLEALIAQYGKVVYESYWENSATLIVEKQA